MYTTVDALWVLYHGKVFTVHAMCNLPGCITGRVTPAAEMKTQRPIRRHQWIAWGQKYYNSETHTRFPSGLLQMYTHTDRFLHIYHFQTTHILCSVYIAYCWYYVSEYNSTYQWSQGTAVSHFEGRDPGKHTNPGFHLWTPKWEQGSAAAPPLQRHLGRQFKAASDARTCFVQSEWNVWCWIRELSTNCIAIEKENSMCWAILFLYYVKWVGAIEVSISL